LFQNTFEVQLSVEHTFPVLSVVGS